MWTERIKLSIRDDGVSQLVAMSYSEEVERLFDLSTVVGDDNQSPGKFKKRIVTINKPLLLDSSIGHTAERFVHYEKVDADRSKQNVNLNFIKACGTLDQQKGNSAVMPSLRLEMLEREYQEPVRDRDKDWVLHSQRPIINEKGKDIVSPAFELSLGKYRHVESLSKQFWAPEYQTMLREHRLLRQATIISDTNCVVEIFGVGFNGRIFSEGASSPKFLVIEVYSIWNCQKYSLVLTVLQLRLLLAAKPELLKPGRRSELLQVVLHSLYFDYTITIPPKDSDHTVPLNTTKTESKAHTDMQKAMEEFGITKHQQKIELKQLLQHELNVQHHALNQLDVEHVASDWAHSPSHSRAHSTPGGSRSNHGTPHGSRSRGVTPKSRGEPEVALKTETNGMECDGPQVQSEELDIPVEAAQQADLGTTTKSMAASVRTSAPQEEAHVQTVSHLQSPVMPRGYPTTVEQMIRIPPVPPENSTDPLPIITQELKVSPERRYNGIELRKREAELRRIAQEKEEKRLRAIWLATPKRKRNLVGIRLIRKCNFLVILMGYFDPIRPGTILLTGTVYNEATRMTMFLGMGRIKEILDIKTKSDSWSNEELKDFMKKILKRSGIVRLDSGGYAINVTSLTGGDNNLFKVRTVEEFLFAVRFRRRPAIDARLYSPDSLSVFYTPLLGDSAQPNIAVEREEEETASYSPMSVSQTNTRSASPNTSARYSALASPASAQDDAPLSVLDQVTAALSAPVGELKQEFSLASLNLPAGWTSLGAQRSSRCVGRTLGTVLRPFRELGKPLRLTSRATRVSGVYCVYSLYANTTNMNHRRPIPVWPARVPRAETAADEQSVEEKEPEGSDEDEDFMKNGSDSDEESDSDDDLPANKSSTAKKSQKSGKIKKKSGSMEIVVEEEVNEADEKNDVFVTLSDGLELDLVVYIPAGAEYQGVSIPAAIHKISFCVDDLDKFFPYAEKEMLARALRAVYFDFFDSATPAQVLQAETDWDFIGARIMSLSRWAVRTPVSAEVTTAVLDLHYGAQNIDVLQEVFDTQQRLEYVQTLLWSDAAVLPPSTPPLPPVMRPRKAPRTAQLASDAEISEVPVSQSVKVTESTSADPVAVVLTPPAQYVALSWSNVVYQKALKIRSAVPSRGDVRVQMVVYQKGQGGSGIVCYDRQCNEVYFAQHSDAALIQTQIQGFRFITPTERAVQMYIFLSSSLTYTETAHKDNIMRGKVSFGMVEEAAAILDPNDVVGSDYASTTEHLLNSAASKAQGRMQRAKSKLQSSGKR